MKPPLRGEADRLRLIELLATGVIDCIATDHAPHSRDEKAKPFCETPFGIIGLETAFPLLYDRLVRSGRLSLNRLVDLFTCGPARLIHQAHRLGVVAPKRSANLVIFNAERPFCIGPEFFASKSANSPFVGWEGLGVIEETLVKGKVLYRAL
jgi:dihydroorotase